MNVVELGLFATPICGAVGGGTAVKAAGALATVLGITLGLGLGIALVATQFWFARKVGDHPRWEKFNYSGAGLITFLLVPMFMPVLAFLLSRAVVLRVFTL
jgi:hypothetical protein